MGFRSLPYNSVKMYLIVEEILKGNRHDTGNAFQYNHVHLNLPGTAEYDPLIVWLSKRQSDGSLASNFVCFVNNQRIMGAGSARVIKVGHDLSSRESYLGLQDALQKIRSHDGTWRPGAWAGACVVVEEDVGVAVLTSQDKWDKMKDICCFWLSQLRDGIMALEFNRLQSDRGFMVYATQAYPSMKPHLKGFHLSLETWRGGQDAKGWRLRETPHQDLMDDPILEEMAKAGVDIDGFQEEGAVESMEDIKLWHLIRSSTGSSSSSKGPILGLTAAVRRFRQDLEALLQLTQSEKPILQRLRSANCLMAAFYGFGDASSSGFGASIACPDGLHTQYRIWPSDIEDKSSNYCKLKNLVNTTEEELKVGYLKDSELWLFTDNSTAESCFHKGSSSSKALHNLVVRLKKIKLEVGFTLFVVHVAGTRMITQGTDSLLRGSLLEGVMIGHDMLHFIPLAQGALERQPSLVDYVQSWVGNALHREVNVLKVEGWFQEGHGMIGGFKDAHGVWMPRHAENRRVYLWSPPLIVANVALEECMKAIYKQTDAFHIFLIPRLFSPTWL
jgi:hypothetical protein